MVSGPSPRTQRVARIFWLTTGAALVLRAVHIIAMSDPATNPTFIAPVTDAGVHHRWAQQILGGSWPGSEPFFRAPLYPYFLAGLYQVFGLGHPLAVQLVHGVISAAGAGFAALCAQRLWDQRAAWGAGLLFATLGTSIYFSGELLAVTLSVTLNLALLWLLLLPPTRRRMVLCGVVLGLSAISRPTVLVALPVVSWYLWQRAERAKSGSRTSLALVAIGLLVTIAPVSAHNFLRGKEPVLIAASGGVNFYIGNNEHADGRVAFLPGAPPTWQGEMSDVIALASAEAGHPMTARQADAFFWRQGLGFWRDDPVRALHLLGRKLWLLAASGERSNNKNLAFWYRRSPLLRWPVWPGWALVLGLAVLGFGGRLSRRPEHWLLLGVTAIYSAALLLFFINARFRLPVMAWLTVPAGAGLVHLWRGLRHRDWSTAPRWAWALAAIVTTISVVPDGLTYHPDPATNFESWRSLGNSYATTDQPSRAKEAWLTALAIDSAAPQSAHRWTLPAIYRPLADLYRQQGQIQQAVAIHRQWSARLPGSVPAQLGLADLLLQTGDPHRASILLAEIVRDHPRHTDARLGYAWSLTQLGQYPAATAQLDTLLARKPLFWQGWEALAEIYTRTNEPTQEQRCWQHVLRERPQHKRAKQRLQRLR